MPRPIKFRAWVTEFEEPLFMLYNVTPFYILDGDFNTADRIYGYKEGEEMSTKVKSDTCKFHLMQFTGLTDKNGKEIYEGDIVRYEFKPSVKSTPKTWEVHFDGGCFGVHLAFESKKKPGGFLAIRDIARLDSLEVIGNIHENPEEVKDA